MGEPAFALIEELAAEEAVSSAVELTVIEGGGLASATGSAAQLTLIEGGAGLAGSELAVGGVAAAEVGGAVVAGEAVGGGALAVGAGTAVATAGIGLLVLALVGLGYYIYKRSASSDPKTEAPKQPEAVAPCPKAGPASSSKPVMPATLSAADQELWKECSALRDTYKQTQSAGAKQSAAIKPALDDMANNRPVTPADKLALCHALVALIQTLKQLMQERQDYVNEDCDKFDWFNQGTTQQARKQAHEKEVENVGRQIKNIEKWQQKFCGP